MVLQSYVELDIAFQSHIDLNSALAIYVELNHAFPSCAASDVAFEKFFELNVCAQRGAAVYSVFPNHVELIYAFQN